MEKSIELEATLLDNSRKGKHYAVRPLGCLGTHGKTNGQFWSVYYTSAKSAKDAIRKAEGKVIEKSALTN